MAKTLDEIRRKELLGHSLRACDPAWLRGLSRGTVALLAGAVWVMVSGATAETLRNLPFGLATVPPWVLSGWGVWKLSTREPRRRIPERQWILVCMRVIAVVMLCAPVLMIEPGYLRYGYTVLIYE